MNGDMKNYLVWLELMNFIEFLYCEEKIENKTYEKLFENLSDIKKAVEDADKKDNASTGEYFNLYEDFIGCFKFKDVIDGGKNVTFIEIDTEKLKKVIFENSLCRKGANLKILLKNTENK